MERIRLGYKQGIISIIVNIILFALKYWAGIVSGSVALIADAWHTLSDSVSSLIVIAGVKLASKKPDKQHPFGHGRWEQIAAIFIAFLLGIVAYEFIRESIDKLQSRESANFGTIAVIITIVSILAKEALARYAFYISRKTDNTSIKADGWHHRTDALSSVIVLIGIFLKGYFWWIDSILGIIISLMLFYATFEIVKESINKLLGEKPSDELIKKVKKIIRESESTELNPHHFHVHNYGTHMELTFHLKFDKNIDLYSAHSIATNIENNLLKQLSIETTIHIEPEDVEHEND